MANEQADTPYAPMVSKVIVNRLDLDPTLMDNKDLTPQQLENYYNQRYQSLMSSEDQNIKTSGELGLIGIEFNNARQRNDQVGAQRAMDRARSIMDQQGLSVSDISKGLNEYGTNAGQSGKAILGGGLALISALAGSGARPAPTELVDKVSTTLPKLMTRYREAAASGNLASAFDIRSSIEAIIAKNRGDMKSILPVLNASGGEEQQQTAQLIDGLVNDPDSIFLNVNTVDKDGDQVNLGNYLQTLPEDQRNAISDSVKANIARRLGSSIVGTTAKWAEAAYDWNNPLHSIISPLYNTVLAGQESTGAIDPKSASAVRIAKNRLQAITSFYDNATKNGVFQNDEEAAAFIDGMQGVLGSDDPAAPVLPISEAELTKAGNLFKQMKDSGENISAKDFAVTMQSLQRAMTTQVAGPNGAAKSVQNYAFDSKALMNLALSTQLAARDQGLAIPGIGSKEFGDMVVNAYKKLDQFHTEYGISLFGDKSDPNRSRTLADLVLQMNGMPGSGTTNRLNNMVDVTRKIDGMVNKSGLIETTQPGPDGKPVKTTVRAPSELPEFERIMKQELGRFITSTGDPWTTGSGIFNSIRGNEEKRNQLVSSITDGLVSAGLVLDGQKEAVSGAVKIWLDSNLPPVGKSTGMKTGMSIYEAFRECAVLKTPPELAVLRAQIETAPKSSVLTTYYDDLNKLVPQTKEEKDGFIIGKVLNSSINDDHTLDALVSIAKLNGDDVSKWATGNDTNIVRFIRNLRHGMNKMSVNEVVDVFKDVNSWYVNGKMPSNIANQLANMAFINLNANLDKMGLKRRGQIITRLKDLGFGDGTTKGWDEFIGSCKAELTGGLDGQYKGTKDSWFSESGIMEYDKGIGMADINMKKYISYMIDKNVKNPDINWGNTGDAKIDGARQILSTYSSSDAVKGSLLMRVREKLSADGVDGNEAPAILASLSGNISSLLHSSGGINAAESFVDAFINKSPYYFPNPENPNVVSAPRYLTKKEAITHLKELKEYFKQFKTPDGKEVDLSARVPSEEQFFARQKEYRDQYKMATDSQMKAASSQAGKEYAKATSPAKDD